MNKNTISEPHAIPEISVRIYLPKAEGKDLGKLLGFASVNLGGLFSVHNIRIYDSDKGLFAAMPQRQGNDGKYYDICNPTTLEMREALQDAILDAYAVEAARSTAEEAARAAEGASCAEAVTRPVDNETAV